MKKRTRRILIAALAAVFAVSLGGVICQQLQYGKNDRAIDDARAAALLLEAMAAERDDLEQYIDLFGSHPKYGVSGRKISSVTYRPQPYDRRKPLYELA